MIGQDTSIRKIRMLCVELPHCYNVGCWNWFHGTRLRHAVDRSTVAALSN
ncbi:hypothetical protein [Streptomyces sp. CT34]|nr:hypothetical protein [Streptomyces sp. CT34]